MWISVVCSVFLFGLMAVSLMHLSSEKAYLDASQISPSIVDLDNTIWYFHCFSPFFEPIAALIISVILLVELLWKASVPAILAFASFMVWGYIHVYHVNVSHSQVQNNAMAGYARKRLQEMHNDINDSHSWRLMELLACVGTAFFYFIRNGMKKRMEICALGLVTGWLAVDFFVYDLFNLIDPTDLDALKGVIVQNTIHHATFLGQYVIPITIVCLTLAGIVRAIMPGRSDFDPIFLLLWLAASAAFGTIVLPAQIWLKEKSQVMGHTDFYGDETTRMVHRIGLGHLLLLLVCVSSVLSHIISIKWPPVMVSEAKKMQ